MITFNILLCAGVSVVSMLSKVQERMPYSGLLQSSFLTMYTMYLTWSALMNNPDKECNPSLVSLIHNSTAVGQPHAEVGEEEQSVELYFYLSGLWHAAARPVAGLAGHLVRLSALRLDPLLLQHLAGQDHRRLRSGF